MFKKGIVDERQELASMKNSRICLYVLQAMLCIWLFVKGIGISYQISNFGEANVTDVMIIAGMVLISAILQLVLDGRQGNLFTKENANKKRTTFLFVGAALAVGLIQGISNAILFEQEWYIALIIAIPAFIVTLGLEVLIYSLWWKAAKKRIEKLEKSMEDDIENIDDHEQE